MREYSVHTMYLQFNYLSSSLSIYFFQHFATGTNAHKRKWANFRPSLMDVATIAFTE